MKVTVEQSEDRRIQKTKRLLREALFSLIGEKDYDSIVVKEILDRADVGRSTFYAHFNDKDELLVSGIHDLINSVQATELPRTARPYEQIIRFSLPLLERIDQHRFSLPVLERIDRHRHTEGVRIGARGRAIIHEHLQRVLADLIATDVRKCLRNRRKTAAPIPTGIVVRYVASTFILVLNWWVENRSPLRPTAVNDLFRALVLPTLAATLE
jgi:AcrR family transcriptional regulator